MEVPVINRISEFQVGMNSLNDPSYISRILSFSDIVKTTIFHDFWKWGAVILAFLATFSSIFRRLRILIIRLRTHHSLALQKELLKQVECDDFSDEDADDVASVSSMDYSSSEEEGIDYEEDDQNEVTSTFYSNNSSKFYEDFRVAGSEKYEENQWQNCKLRLRRRFSWSEFANGKSMVKIWEGVGLGLDLNHSSGSLISIYDLGRDQKITQFLSGSRQIRAVSTAAQSVVVSAGNGKTNNLELNVWDPRISCQLPAIFAKWAPQSSNNNSLGVKIGGVEKVYVRNEVTGNLTVGDMRNVSSPLENVSETDGETWWDADAVMITDKKFDCGETALNGRDSVVSRCRDAFKSYLF